MQFPLTKAQKILLGAATLGIAAVVFALSAARFNTQADTPTTGQQILYLVDESQIAADSQRHPNAVAKYLDVTIVNESNIDSVSVQDADAIIIDRSALPFVDRDAVRRAYAQAALVAVFSIPVETFSDLINDPCILQDGFASEPYPGEHFIMAYSYVTGALRTDVEKLKAHTRATCGSTVAAGIEGSAGGGWSAAQSELDTDFELRRFALIVEEKLNSIQQAGVR